MKFPELIRIFVIVALGTLLVFLLQPLLYQWRLPGFFITDEIVEDWLSFDYYSAARLVFIVTILSMVIWFALTANNKALSAASNSKWSLFWWILLIISGLSVPIAVYFFGRSSSDALISLTGLLVFDVFWLFWLPTVTSSPNTTKYIPPGADTIRRLIGD